MQGLKLSQFSNGNPSPKTHLRVPIAFRGVIKAIVGPRGLRLYKQVHKLRQGRGTPSMTSREYVATSGLSSPAEWSQQGPMKGLPRRGHSKFSYLSRSIPKGDMPSNHRHAQSRKYAIAIFLLQRVWYGSILSTCIAG